MMLPFVSREAYDLAKAQAAYFQAKCEAWEQRFLDATKPEPKMVLPAKEADPVTQAIRDAAGGNSALRGHLAHFARSERERGTKPEDIVRKIRDYGDGPQRRDRSDEIEANETLAEILG